MSDPAQRAREAFDRGGAMLQAGRWGEAAAAYSEVIALAPRVGPAWSHLGLALLGANDPGEALKAMDRAAELEPASAATAANRALVLQALGRVREAAEACERALELAPDMEAARANLSVCQLLLGELEAGFRNHEARWLVEPTRSLHRKLDPPLWLGDAPVAGKTVLLHAEQGFGDTLQFCRYAPLVRAMGARVVVEVPATLAPVMASLDGVDQLVVAGEPLPAFDLHCPMMSLPLALRTGLHSIPAPERYLAAPPERVELWRERLGPAKRFRVGIVWAGKPTHHNDANRSIPFEAFARALPEGVEAINLQAELREADRAAVLARPDLKRFEVADFADTAALASLVDLVIAVDTSVAHLAGALGRPTWLLLPFVPDWRWLLGRQDSPWYPSLRLWRQPGLGDWTSVIERARAELAITR